MTDVDRFEAFVRLYQDMVFATAVRLVGRPADAEDIAQTVFLRAFERFDAVSASPFPGAWLKKVTTNLCLNHLSRYRSRWRFFSELEGGGEADPCPMATHASVGPLPDAALEQADRQAQLERALRALPDHQRVPLVLFHFEEQSYQEIAAVLGVSVGKIKTDIHRGRQSLRHWLHDDDRAS